MNLNREALAMSLLNYTPAPMRMAGIAIDGPRPYDPQIKNPLAYFYYLYALLDPSLAFGEAYMNGCIDVEDLEQFYARILSADEGSTAGPLGRFQAWMRQFRDEQSILRSRRVADRHYSLDNRLFEGFLGPTMMYTSARYTDGIVDLNEAQLNKIRRLCRKLGIRPGQKVLDIGCGWGGLAEVVAREFGAEVTGISISEPQIEYARKRCARLPVEFLNKDYREFLRPESKGAFDYVISIEMYEAVGRDNLRTFMGMVRHVLKEDGLFGFQGITGTYSGFNLWLDKYIFPGGHLATKTELAEAYQGLLVQRDEESFGQDYAVTLRTWDRNNADDWPALQATNPRKYTPRFRRMMHNYFMMCAASFSTGVNDVSQWVLAPAPR